MGICPGLDQTLHGLMRRYRERVPDVERIISALIERQVIASPEDIANDHVAFRTIGVEHLGIASLEKIFLAYGYTRRDKYRFDAKKLMMFGGAPITRIGNFLMRFLMVCEIVNHPKWKFHKNH